MVPGNSPSICGVWFPPHFHKRPTQREPSTSTFPLHDYSYLSSSRPALQPTGIMSYLANIKTQFGVCHFFFHCHAYLMTAIDMSQLSRAFILSPDHNSKIYQVLYMMTWSSIKGLWIRSPASVASVIFLTWFTSENLAFGTGVGGRYSQDQMTFIISYLTCWFMLWMTIV